MAWEIETEDVVIERKPHSCVIKIVELSDEDGILLVDGKKDEFFEPHEMEAFHRTYRLLCKRSDRKDLTTSESQGHMAYIQKEGEALKGVRRVTVVHANTYTATIEGEDVLRCMETDRLIELTVKPAYRYQSRGKPRWESIQPIDQDEITHIEWEGEDGHVTKVAVPFVDTSPNGAYRINDHARCTEQEDALTIRWLK